MNYCEHAKHEKYVRFWTFILIPICLLKGLVIVQWSWTSVELITKNFEKVNYNHYAFNSQQFDKKMLGLKIEK